MTIPVGFPTTVIKKHFYVLLVGQDFSIKQMVDDVNDPLEAFHKVMEKYGRQPYEIVRFTVDDLPNRTY